MTMKEKIRNGEKTVGMHVNLNDVAVGKIVGLAGYDFIWIDMEHSYLTLENLLADIYAIKAGGTDVIVRVPQHDLTYTKKVIEMGVDGIIFPMVRSAAEAKELVDMTLYPPLGTRGFGPMNAIDFGYRDVDGYIAAQLDNLCRFIQIEHIDAVNCLDELLKIETIDGFIIGPKDLSGSIGELNHDRGPHTEALIKKVVEKVKTAGKYVGVSYGIYDDATITYFHNMGIDMISAGTDYTYIQQLAVETRKNLERLHKNRT